MIEPLLMTATRVDTYNGDQLLTNASGVFFERDDRLFLVTCRHVVLDEKNAHHPDRLMILIHVDENNLAASTQFSIPLYQNGLSIWRDAKDSEGAVDIAVIEIDRQSLPKTAAYCAFTSDHLLSPDEEVEIGSSLLVIGYPLGFQDVLHRLPVARQAGLASSFGLRFQGKGYFLTDARTHRGISGAAVVMRAIDKKRNLRGLPWRLLGIHSSRLDMSRDLELDEALGLNCTWYADILSVLTKPT